MPMKFITAPDRRRMRERRLRIKSPEVDGPLRLEDLAPMVGIARSTLGKYETGHTAKIHPAIWQAWDDALSSLEQEAGLAMRGGRHAKGA